MTREQANTLLDLVRKRDPSVLGVSLHQITLALILTGDID